MAKYRNDLGEERWVPLIGLLIADGKEFEVDDVVARQNDFSIFTEIKAPAKVEPPAEDAPRSAWIEHAVDHFGIRRETLVDLSTPELVARFGEPAKPEPELPPATATRGELVAFVVEHTDVKTEDLDDLEQPDLLEYIGVTAPTVEEPAKNATREVWAEYARNVLNATDADLDGLGRDALVDKYASKEQS
jgi:hypothetical protein